MLLKLIRRDVAKMEALAEQAHDLAQQAAKERGLPLDRICIRTSPFGKMKVIVLEDNDRLYG